MTQRTNVNVLILFAAFVATALSSGCTSGPPPEAPAPSSPVSPVSSGSSPASQPAARQQSASPIEGTWDIESPAGATALLVLLDKSSGLTGFWETAAQNQPLEGMVNGDGTFSLNGRTVDSSLSIEGRVVAAGLELTVKSHVTGTRISSEEKWTGKRKR